MPLTLQARGRGETALTVSHTYVRLWKVCQLPSIRSLALVVLSCRVGFTGVEAVTALKLQEYGVPKEDLAAIGPMMFPVRGRGDDGAGDWWSFITTSLSLSTALQIGLILPGIMGYLKVKPMDLWLKIYPWRVAMTLPPVALVSLRSLEGTGAIA